MSSITGMSPPPPPGPRLVELLLQAPGGASPVAVRLARDLSLPPPASEAIDAAPYTHGFTGRHDSGALPPPGCNAYAHVLECIAEAKAASDVALRAMLPPSGEEGAVAGERGGRAGAGARGRTKKARLVEEGAPEGELLEEAGGSEGEEG